MGQEVDLLVNYPRVKRNVDQRGNTKTEEDRRIARQFGKDFFNGERRFGYGGFVYNPKFWKPVVPTFQKCYQLDSNSSILDVGCAKGFMLYDFVETIPGIRVSGVDVSEYAIKNAMDSLQPHLTVADARSLPYEDNSFDLVISINTVHNLERDDLIQALQEIERVSRNNSFITVDAYHNEDEHKKMMSWNLTAKTILHVDEWKKLFKEAGYTGDYCWFIP